MTYCNKYKMSIVTGPSVEPISLTEALVQCHANSGVEDDWFYAAITAVRQDAEAFQRRAYIEQTIRLTFDNFPIFPIYLPRPPLIEVTSFSLYDVDDTQSVISLSDLQIDTYSQPARIDLTYGYSFPSITLRSLNSIVIEYTAGYGTTADDVPKDIRQAMLLHLGYLYDCRSGEADPITEQYENLLNRHRIWL